MIIIKNYSMPHNCYDCDIHNYHECNLTSESIEEDYCWNGDNREKHCPLREVEAIPKADYEAKLKADVVAMLEELALKLYEQYDDTDLIKVKYIRQAIQQKINSLKGGEGNYNT